MRRGTRGRWLTGLVVVLAVVLVAAVVLAFALGGVAPGIAVAVIAVLGPATFYYRVVELQPGRR